MPLGRALILPAALVFALVAALYAPTLRGGFVYDSIAQVLQSDYIHTPSHWGDVLTLRVVGQDELDRNRPLHLASLMIDAAVWGKNPFGYRLSSVLLHALNASLLFCVIFYVLPASGARRLFAAAAGTLAFALHPMVVEAVAEPSNREDVLVLLAILCGVLAIARAGVRPPRSIWPLGILLVVLGFLAVAAKESGVAAPFVFAVALWLLARAQLARCRAALLLCALLVGSFLAVSYLWRPTDSAIFVSAPLPLHENFWVSLGIEARIFALQLRQIGWPTQLSAHYPAQVLGSWSWSSSLGFSAALLGVLLLVARRNRLALFGVAVFLLTLLPAANFVPQFHPIADRYLYVPLAGLGLVAAAGLAALARRGTALSPVLASLVVLALGAEYTANLRRQRIWCEADQLWADVLQQFPQTAVAYFGLSDAAFRCGDFTAALVPAICAVDTSSGRWADPYAMRALCEWQTGQHAAARESFRRAAHLSRVYSDPDSVRRSMLWSSDQQLLLRDIAGWR